MPLKTHDIEGVEVFAEGEWNGKPFSTADLDTIVDSFNKTKDRLKPYVKLGHNSKQALLKSDGLPAAGWIEELKRSGNKLVAKLSRVPAKVKELIDAGAYRRVSVELIPKYRMGDQVCDMALAGLALLGGKTPAVDTLDDIVALYGGECEMIECNAEATAESYDFDREALYEKEGVMEKLVEELRTQVADLKAKLEASEAKFSKFESDAQEREAAEAEAKSKFEADIKAFGDEAKAQKERADKAESECAKFAAEKRATAIAGKVDELIRQKKLAPAQKELAVAAFEKAISGELTFSHGGTEYKSADELLFALFQAGQGVTLGEETETDAGKAKRDDLKDGVSGAELHEKAVKYQADHKVSYKEALVVVSRKEPK